MNQIAANEPLATREKYLQDVRQLLRTIEEWLKPLGVDIEWRNVELYEEGLGRYEAPALVIFSPSGKHIASLEPVGALVIGARGRVDLRGKVDRAGIVYLENGGPELEVRTIDSGHEEVTRKSLLRGVQGPGWYWAGDVMRKRAHPLTKDLFFDLLTGVSDYAFSV